MRYPKEVTLAKKALSDHKGENIAVVDVRQNTPFADYLVIASANNIRMLGALANSVEEGFAKAGVRVRQQEGTPESEWIVVDAGAVVVHVFTEEKRKEIDLDGLLTHSSKKK
ncbi:MAG: ribosome silencing factor [Bacilli bacterium]|jgi:ribosome-associated protein|nr:ribosome silencing factor [Bacilli bacterium]MCI2111287.1 ribosome silencing factor [Bacilli bacterium]